MNLKPRYPVLGLLLILVVVLTTSGFLATRPNSTVYNQERTLIKTEDSTRQAVLPTRWNKTFGSSQFDFISDVVECSSGGFVFTGAISFPVNLQDAWLVKTDIHGNQLWNHSWGGTYDQQGWSLAECSDGGFIITGRTRTDSTGDDVLLLRTNSTGHQQWNQTFNGDLDDHDTGLQVIECSSGGFAIIGYTTTAKTNSEDLWLIRTNDLGQHLWNESFGYGDEDWGYSIVECSGGGFAVCGNLNGSGFWEGILVRTDAGGNQLWNKTYIADGQAYKCFSVIECSSGGFALSGVHVNIISPHFVGMWLLRTDANGVHQWNQTFVVSPGSYYDEAWDLVECGDGGFALSGTANYNWDAIGPPPTDTRFGAGESDICLLRTDASGNHVWNQSYGGIGEEWGFSLITCIDGGFLLTGQLSTQSPTGDDGWLIRVAHDNLPPIWDEMPTDQIVFVNVAFRYDLDATDPEGLLDMLWLNDTTNFAIDAEGVITNASALAEGAYGVQVSVNDTYGHVLTGTFTVTVLPLPPPIPGFPVIAIVVGVAAALGLGLVTRRYKHL